MFIICLFLASILYNKINNKITRKKKMNIIGHQNLTVTEFGLSLNCLINLKKVRILFCITVPLLIRNVQEK